MVIQIAATLARKIRLMIVDTTIVLIVIAGLITTQFSSGVQSSLAVNHVAITGTLLIVADATLKIIETALLKIEENRENKGKAQQEHKESV